MALGSLELVKGVKDPSIIDTKLDEKVEDLADENKSNEQADKKLDGIKNNLKAPTDSEVTEDPINTLITITKTPVQLIHAVLTGNETSKHAKEISDIIGYNLKKIVKKFFKIANDALDNLNTINNAGLISAIVQMANFMATIHSTFRTYTNPSEWQQTLALLTSNLPDNLNIRLPLNLRSPNAHHEDFFDDYL